MKKFVEVIHSDGALKSMIPLNMHLGEVTARDLSYETESLTYIYSSRYQTNLLFMQFHYKPVSRLIPQKYKSNDHETGA